MVTANVEKFIAQFRNARIGRASEAVEDTDETCPFYWLHGIFGRNSFCATFGERLQPRFPRAIQAQIRHQRIPGVGPNREVVSRSASRSRVLPLKRERVVIGQDAVGSCWQHRKQRE